MRVIQQLITPKVIYVHLKRRFQASSVSYTSKHTYLLACQLLLSVFTMRCRIKTSQIHIYSVCFRSLISKRIVLQYIGVFLVSHVYIFCWVNWCLEYKAYRPVITCAYDSVCKIGKCAKISYDFLRFFLKIFYLFRFSYFFSLLYQSLPFASFVFVTNFFFFAHLRFALIHTSTVIY